MMIGLDVCCGGHCVCGCAFPNETSRDSGGDEPPENERGEAAAGNEFVLQPNSRPAGGILLFFTTLATECLPAIPARFSRTGPARVISKRQKNAILMGMCLKIKEKLPPFPAPSNWILTGFNQRVCGCPLDFPVLEHVEGNANGHFSRQRYVRRPRLH